MGKSNLIKNSTVEQFQYTTIKIINIESHRIIKENMKGFKKAKLLFLILG